MDFEFSNTEMPNVETNTVSYAPELPTSSPVLSRGYFGIGIENTKTKVNVGTLWRSANLFGASFVFTIGRRYAKQSSDTMKTERHIPLYHYEDFEQCYSHLPYGCQLIGVELSEQSVALPRFCHPERAIYLLGAEDHGLTNAAIEKCHHIIQIPCVKSFSMNVAVAGSLVMYDRFTKATQGSLL